MDNTKERKELLNAIRKCDTIDNAFTLWDNTKTKSVPQEFGDDVENYCYRWRDEGKKSAENQLSENEKLRKQIKHENGNDINTQAQ